MKQSRRSFLQTTLAASAAFSLPARSRAAVPGANSDIRLAVVGFNGRGKDHIKNYSALKGVRIVALCDVDEKVLAAGMESVKSKGGDPTAYGDLRKLLESKEIDAVSVAAPNHWHALMGIWTLQAGKDLYVEKPISHQVWEGRQLVNAASKSKQIVQMGVQSRSGAGLAAALEWLKTQPLGKLQYARGLCYKRRASIGKVDGVQPIPAGVDYDLWCGPAAKAPLTRGKLHYDWHWVWNTGNGDLGNQGIHQMDIARRFLGESGISPAVFAVGGRLGYVDDGETPNTLFVCHEYPNAPLIFEVRGLPEKTGVNGMDSYRGASVGVIVQYENGYIRCPNYLDAIAYDKSGKVIQKFGNPPAAEGDAPAAEKTGDEGLKENHYANFIDVVRSRKAADLRGKIIEGHVSSALCHTGNISYLLGQKADPGEIREKVKGNKDAMDSLERMVTHLGANAVDLNVDKLTLGEFLKFDPKTEKFVGNAAADQLLKREARAPFVVPEIA